MADVDILRDAYRNSLGRDASEAELQGWTSGQYGGGNVNDWVNQIRTSGEAQAYGGQQGQVAAPAPDTYHHYNEPQASGGGDDPFNQFAASLNQGYGQYLGRSASQDEIQNWWSGGYGHGSGMSGLQSMLEGIRTSGEAKSRNGGTAPSSQYQDLAYWQGQGFNPSQMFANDGQMLPGWARTGKGYERTGTNSISSSQDFGGPQGGDYQSWIMQLVQGKAPSPQSLKALEPTLNKYGIKLGPLNARGFTDGIILPDGTFIDLIEAATETGGKGWAFMRPGPASQQLPGNQYSDPYTRLFEQLAKSFIASRGPVNDPNRAAYEAALKQRADALAQYTPQLNQLTSQLQGRLTDLRGPGYTGAENEVLRTGALDPIETDRKAARDRVLQRLSQRGINPNSGVAQQMLLEVDKAFDAMRGQTQTQLTTNDIARREDRAQRADTIAGTLAQIPEERAREQLDVFSALERLSQLARNEDDARAREAVTYGGALSDLGPQRLQLAMQALGQGGNPSSLGSVLSNIAGMNQNAAAYEAQDSDSLWSGLGSLAAIIGRQSQWGLGG